MRPLRIHRLRLAGSLKPATQPFRYPAHSRDYGVEQDFDRWLDGQPGLLTDDPAAADWHYLGAYWTRWHLNHDYGRQGRDELQSLAAAALLDPARTFTVCQYDDGPGVDLGATRTYLASRKSGPAYDLPLLCDPHPRPWMPVRKRYTASFVGRLATHPLRQAMAAALAGRADVGIFDGDQGADFFVRTTLASRAALCPRGYGGSSFRLFEAMQLGVAPVHIGDLDTRPFRRLLDWDSASLHTDDPARLPALLDGLGPARLKELGRAAQALYRERLAYGRWCGLLVEDLALEPLHA